MTIFIQGMRRSGTTILYDALAGDPGLRCFYEPFREDSETPGGGSGARAGDPFAETRALRESFRDEHYPQLDLSEFNWGGPRDPALELEPRLPEHCRRFLDHLVDQQGEVLIKFTRMYDKVADLHEADPDALLVHVVRDPRAVAASMMLGRGAKRADRYSGPDEFFSERERRKLWSSRQLSGLLLARPEYTHVRRAANYLRILVVWRHTFEQTRRAGRELFGDRYLLVRNEDLRTNPGAELERIYAAARLEMPAAVSEWAATAVRPPEEPFAADDPRWLEGMATLAMREAVEEAGYPALAASIGERRSPARLQGMIGRARRRAGDLRRGPRRI